MADQEKINRWVRRQIDLLGITEADPGYAEAIVMAHTGYSAWRIAKAMGAPAEMVRRLGGPER